MKEMNATIVASGTKAVPPVVSSIQDVPLAKIRESKTNPRRFFDEAKLAELADFVPGNKIRELASRGHVALKELMWRLGGIRIVLRDRERNRSTG
jgi:hypothetical protein